MLSQEAPKAIFSYRKYWAQRFGTAPFLPMSREEMERLGWDSCDVILITGDAYIDHPSFGMALVGRLLEAQGFRVGIISQPDWHSAKDFQRLGKPNLFFGITAGNMDSMVNRYTSDRKIRSDDAYTPNAEPNKRPDRAVTVYAQRAREAYPGMNLGRLEENLGMHIQEQPVAAAVLLGVIGHMHDPGKPVQVVQVVEITGGSC